MRITVNGEPRDLTDDASVRDLIRAMDLEGRPCAAEVNGTLVPRNQHDTRSLTDGDVVELVTLVGGG